jgi:endonuclease YncB( thermonuclease family)
MRAVLVAALLAVTSSALADFTGRVVKVADGDTLTVLVNKTQIRVRLDGIDAPESKQAFGKLLDGPLKFTPTTRAGVKHLGISGETHLGAFRLKKSQSRGRSLRMSMTTVFIRLQSQSLKSL